MSKVALNNITYLLASLKSIDYLFFKPTHLFYMLLTHVLIQLPRHVGYSIIDHYDGYLTFDIGRYFAEQFKIPLIIGGLTSEQANAYYRARWHSTEKGEIAARKEHLPVKLDKKLIVNLTFWNTFENFTRQLFIFPLAAWQSTEHTIKNKVLSIESLNKRGSQHPLMTNNTFYPYY